MGGSSYSLFRKRKFLPIFITQFQEALTDNLIKNALIVLAAYEVYANNPGASSIVVALAGALLMLPFFLFSSLAGQLADKFDKSVIVRFIKGFEIFSMILAVYGFHSKNIWILLSTVFLLGLHSAFFGPIKYSILPQHLEEKELISGNAFVEGATFIAILLGCILGSEMPSIFKSTMRIGGLYTSILGLVLGILGFLVSFLIPPAPSKEPDLLVDINIFRSTAKIIKYARKSRRVYMAIFGIACFWFTGMTFMTLLPNFVKDVLNGSNSVFTLFLVTFSVGIAVGALMCEKIQRQNLDTRYVPIGALGMCIFILILYFLTSNYAVYGNTHEIFSIGIFLKHFKNWLIIIDIFFIAIFGGFYIVPLNTVVQYWSDKKYMSRIIATSNIMNSLLMVIGAVFFILCIKIRLSIPHILLCLGILNLIIALYISKLLPHAILKVFFEWIFILLYKVKVEGLENFKNAGNRILIVANHTSFIDGLLLGVFLPVKPIYAINNTVINKWWVKVFENVVELYPIDSTNPTHLKTIVKEIKKRKPCIIFPEGRLTMTGALMKVYEEPGTIAEQSGAVILPVRIEGALYTPFTRAKGKIYTKLFPKITIKILPPQKFEIDKDLLPRERRHITSIKLYKLMADMIFESSNIEEKIFESVIKARKLHSSKHRILEDLRRKPITYRVLIRNSFILGTHIMKEVKNEKNIAILLPNVIETVYLFMGLHSRGKVPVFLNFTAGIKNLIYSCKIADVKTIYTARKFVSTGGLQELIEAFKENSIKIVYLEDLIKALSLRSKLTGLFYSFFPLTFFKRLTKNVSYNDTAVILFTSGSEGMPKGVALNHSNLQANRFQIAAKVDINDSDTVFNTLPLFHSFGLSGGTLLPLIAGVKVFLYPSPLHYRIIAELIYDSNSSILFGTDTFLKNYANVAHPYDFYNVRYVFAGAEKLNQSTQELWNSKFGIRIFEGYGATETSPILAVNTPMENKIGSVGKFLPKVEYNLVPIEGITEGGRLMVKGPNIMKGYLDPENIGSVIELKDNWYDTGDIVKLDSEEYVYIMGRVKRFAKVAGEMISLTQVETEISELYKEKKHAVISVSDDKKGEQLTLITEEDSIKKNTLLEKMKKKGITELAVPKNIVYMNELPLLGTGKIDYVKLQNDFASQKK